jgi:hypothetical protein
MRPPNRAIVKRQAMDERQLRRAAWRAAFFGMSPDHYEQIYTTDIRATAANVTIIREEAAREYEYLQRAIESLDNKGAVALAGSLALITFAGASDGHLWARAVVLLLALGAGIICGTMLVPEKVRGVRSLVMARKHGRERSDHLTLRYGLQYIDAVEATRLPALVKALRLRAAILLLFVAAAAVYFI